MKKLDAIFDELTASVDRKTCQSMSPRHLHCTRQERHGGLHRGRSRFGGSHEQWSTQPSRARRKTRGASKHNRRAVQHRRADRLTRKTGQPHTVIMVKGKPTVAILVTR